MFGGIDVAHDDDRHAVGAIEIAIEIADALRRHALQQLGQPDRQAIDVARLAEEPFHLRALHARPGALSSAPLLDDDAALAVDLAVVERRHPPAKSLSASKPRVSSPSRSVGTSSMYTVSSKLV